MRHLIFHVIIETNVKFKRMDMKRIITFSCALVIAVLVLTGCASIDVVYDPSDPITTKPVAEKLFFASLKDELPVEQTLPFDPNSDLSILIPCLPYSKSDVNPLVKYNYLQPALPERINTLLIKDLKESGLFKEYLIADNKMDTPPDAYMLKVTLKNAVWHRYLTAYGISYPGYYLWLFLPVSYGSVEFAFEAALFSPANSHYKLIGKKLISKKVNCTEWIYDQIGYKPAKSEICLTEMFPEMTKEMREFILESVKSQNK